MQFQGAVAGFDQTVLLARNAQSPGDEHPAGDLYILFAVGIGQGKLAAVGTGAQHGEFMAAAAVGQAVTAHRAHILAVFGVAVDGRAEFTPK